MAQDFQHQLFTAIAAHFDQVLTPEVATSIVKAAVTAPERSIALASIEPSQYCGYVFASEDVRGIVGEIAPLMRACADESRAPMGCHPTSPEALIERQGRGLYTFTTRKDGQLVGVCFAHRARDGASDAGMYLVPEHRKGWAAVRFVQFVQRGMQALGAKWMTWECEETSGSRRIVEYLGHELFTKRYFVRLESHS